jgi:hypothetical protein
MYMTPSPGPLGWGWEDGWWLSFYGNVGEKWKHHLDFVPQNNRGRDGRGGEVLEKDHGI